MLTSIDRGDGTGVAYRGGPLAAGSLLQYGITPIDSAKTDVTMRFYVEHHPQEAIYRL